MADLRAGVLLVDSLDVVHLGLRVLLGRQPWVTRVLSARRGADAVLLAERHRPAVALVDLFVGEEYGIHICEAIHDRAPDVRVLLTSSSATLTQHAARVAGAAGFVSKDGALSRRQQEILNLMAEGATNAGIADTLGLSVDTVKHHTTLIYRRLDVPNRAAAVHLAQRLGLLTEGATPIGLAPQDTARPPLRRVA
jgi:DNA-binding NarL/FixJ family response regulator